ncbi:phage scaffolding protein [uncultured Duncaniella sp.]|uniref:phage scaffolding protein n=1 Tax=uncultured Duncaniella sp. TaxID=2768039 RepID=UPI0026273856|nr:phage scaffolding protein [uncultured Duncaniella sp.]
MSLLDTLRKSLTSELFAKVTDALGDDFNYDQVPRSRLNKVIAQRDEAKRQLETLTQGSDGDDDDDDSDDGGAGGGTPPAKQKKAPAGGFTQKDLDDAVQAEKDKAATELKNLRLKFAATEKLHGANIVDPDMVLSAGLIDLTKVTTNDNGVITGGLDEQITELTKNRPYLVAAGSGGAPKGTGKSGGADDFGSITSKEDFLKLSTEQQLKFKEANPEIFKGFMAQI